MKPPVLFIVGPTAAGKSKIAVALARRLKGEIISADSMLVYKGMDIGTAKPLPEERKKIPHHLMDLFLPSRGFSVFEYRRRALRAIHDIHRRGKLPIVTGGTGLYVRALLQGLAAQPGADLKLRRRLSQRVKTEGLKALYEELKGHDPKRASEIHPGDERRIVRALEIAHRSRIKPSEFWGSEKSLEGLGYQPIVIGMTKGRQSLYSDIEKRVDQMFRKGLVREVKRLAQRELSRTALQAVGYKEVLAAFRGEYSLAEAKAFIKKNTRHLAKRQWTWFKREQGIHWVSWETGERTEDMAKRIIQWVSRLTHLKETVG